MTADDLLTQSRRMADELTKLSESELIARMAAPLFSTGATALVGNQIELEMQRRSIIASRELKASNDRASRWLIRATILIVIVAVLQLAASLHVLG